MGQRRPPLIIEGDPAIWETLSGTVFGERGNNMPILGPEDLKPPESPFTNQMFERATPGRQAIQ